MANEGRRATVHSARATASGVFNVNHNDRETRHAEIDKHIHTDMSQHNEYFYCYENYGTFRDCERRAYDELFGSGLQHKNERYMKQRHPERCKTIDDLLNDKRTAPLETLLYAGDNEYQIPKEDFLQIAAEQIYWEQERFPQMVLLDIADHEDEFTRHVHERVCFWAYDKNGDVVCNQTLAFEQMGIERPDPSKPRDRYNNPLQTFTAMRREHFQQLIREHGYELVTDPREPGKSGLAHSEFKNNKLMEEHASWEAAIDKIRDGVDYMAKWFGDQGLRRAWDAIKNGTAHFNTGRLKTMAEMEQDREQRIQQLERER